MSGALNQYHHGETDPAQRRAAAFGPILTGCECMHRLFSLTEKVAASETTTLIRGETGTGKELLARAIHKLSPRASMPFYAINCATLTSEFLASELFGHVRGAFTGAATDRRGIFELAHRGTVFLDEVAEIPPTVQAQLLRVLQERTFVPLGGSQEVRVDVRVISATNESLRELVEQKRFRADLMYRLRVVPLFLPPLRERPGDAVLLADRFLAEFSERGPRRIDHLAPDAIEAIDHYPWPGNIRELRNAIEYAFITGDGPVLQRNDLPPEVIGEATPYRLLVRPAQPPPPPATDGAPKPVGHAALTRQAIEAALAATGGNRAAAARHLGVDRVTLWRHLRAPATPGTPAASKTGGAAEAHAPSGTVGFPLAAIGRAG
jgi:two-component system, NtrC family, response regulator AtoC